MLRLFNVYIPTSVVALLLSEVILLFTCYVLAAAMRMTTDLEVFFLYGTGFLGTGTVVGSIVVGMYFQDLYTQFRVRSRLVLIQQVCLAIGVAFLIQAILNYVSPGLLLPRWVMLYGSALALIVIPLWRYIYGMGVMQATVAQRVLFIGTNNLVQQLATEFDESPEMGLRCVGFVDNPSDEIPENIELLGQISDLKPIVEVTRPDRIVVGLKERRGRLPVNTLLELRFSGIPIEQAGALFEATFGRITTQELRPSDLIFTGGLGPRQSSVRFQSIYSFIIGATMLILLSPIMVAVAILVKLTSKGPILYRQIRVGKDDKPFTVYKFRSMRVDAEARSGAVWATKNDPRITPIGKWLRKLRFDELPQLFNVINGDMSMVGPRPERPEFTRTLEQQIPFYRQRTCVKPGVTGWAQINYKYGDTIEDTIAKLEYDLYYIKHLSLALDLYIIFSTIKTVLTARGAQ